MNPISVALRSLLLCVVLALLGCSGDGRQTESATTRPTASTLETASPAEVIAADLLAHARVDSLRREQATCLAETLVDDIGIDRLEAVGLDVDAGAPPELTTPPLTEAEGDLVWTAYDECLDHTARDIEAFTADGLTEAQARCASDRYRGSPIPRTHLLLRNHDTVPHTDLHLQVEALWEGSKAECQR